MAKTVTFDESKNTKYLTYSHTNYVRLQMPINTVIKTVMKSRIVEFTYGPFFLKIFIVPARGLFAIDKITRKYWVVGESRLIESLIRDAVYDLFIKINSTIQSDFEN